MFKLNLFKVQVGVTAASMAFVIVQLSRGMATEVWLPVLTSLIGYWLPQPRPEAEFETPPAREDPPASAEHVAVDVPEEPQPHEVP